MVDPRNFYLYHLTPLPVQSGRMVASGATAKQEDNNPRIEMPKATYTKASIVRVFKNWEPKSFSCLRQV
jgi:hypothetical protein